MPARVPSRGFTLVEVLLVLGIAMIIMALLIPALGHTRMAADRLTCQSQLRQHMQVMALYAADHDDAWPYPLMQDRGRSFIPNLAGRPEPYDPYELSRVLEEHGPNRVYYATFCQWHMPLADAYDMNPAHQALYCPVPRRGIYDRHGHAFSQWRCSTYSLSASMLLHRDALNPDDPAIDDQNHWTGRRHSEVRFPSAKAALFESLPYHDARFVHNVHIPDPRLQNIAAADGSVAHRSLADAVEGLEAPDFSDSTGDVFKLHFTPHGVEGLDW